MVTLLSKSDAEKRVQGLKGWTLREKEISKIYKFKNLVQAMVFVNRIAEVAEAAGHHPDLFIHYNQVTVSLWTHVVGGLSENDFSVAAKVDAL